MQYAFMAENVISIKKKFMEFYDEDEGKFLSKYIIKFGNFEPHYQCFEDPEFIMKYYDNEFGYRDIEFKFKFGYNKALMGNPLYISFGTNADFYMINVPFKMDRAKFKYMDGIFIHASIGSITLKENNKASKIGMIFKGFADINTLAEKGPFYLIISDEPIGVGFKCKAFYDHQEEMHRKAIDEIIDSVIKEKEEKKEYKNLAEFRDEFMENVRKEKKNGYMA